MADRSVDAQNAPPPLSLLLRGFAMYTAIGYAAQSATTPLAPMSFERRSPRADDVAIEILYCGVCHSDIHQARNEWGIAVYPLMPGHEIIGRVTAVGDKVSAHKVGDLVGVGVIVKSCGECENCLDGDDHFVIKGDAKSKIKILIWGGAVEVDYVQANKKGKAGRNVRINDSKYRNTFDVSKDTKIDIDDDLRAKDFSATGWLLRYYLD